MKKPEPCAMLNWRPRGEFGELGAPGMPKRLKNCSRPGGRSSPLDCICWRCDDVSGLTRTPITAGFTRSTMSAKPVGRAAFSALTWPLDWALAVVVMNGMLVRTPGPPNRTAAPILATEARRTSRRTDRTLRGLGLDCITDSPIREMFLWGATHPCFTREDGGGRLTVS